MPAKVELQDLYAWMPQIRAWEQQELPGYASHRLEAQAPEAWIEEEAM